jgi:spore maturation protein CgeB
MQQMRNTPFIIDFTTICVDCAERLVTIELVNATNVYCITDLYTLMECPAKNTTYSEFLRGLLSHPVTSSE